MQQQVVSRQCQTIYVKTIFRSNLDDGDKGEGDGQLGWEELGGELRNVMRAGSITVESRPSHGGKKTPHAFVSAQRP